MSASRKIAQQNINDSRVLIISLFFWGDNLRNDAGDVEDDCNGAGQWRRDLIVRRVMRGFVSRKLIRN
jgi:hypothetical protein